MGRAEGGAEGRETWGSAGARVRSGLRARQAPICATQGRTVSVRRQAITTGSVASVSSFKPVRAVVRHCRCAAADLGWLGYRGGRSHELLCPRQDCDDQPPEPWPGHGEGWCSVLSHQWPVHVPCCHDDEAPSCCVGPDCPRGLEAGGREVPRWSCRSERRPASAGYLACHLASSSVETVGFRRTSSRPRSTVDSGGASSPWRTAGISNPAGDAEAVDQYFSSASACWWRGRVSQRARSMIGAGRCRER